MRKIDFLKAFLFLWPHFGQLFKKFYSTTALNGVALVMFSSVIILSLFSIQFCYRQNRIQGLWVAGATGEAVQELRLPVILRHDILPRVMRGQRRDGRELKGRHE